MSQMLADALNGPFADSGVSILPVLNPRSAGWDSNEYRIRGLHARLQPRA